MHEYLTMSRYVEWAGRVLQRRWRVLNILSISLFGMGRLSREAWSRRGNGHEQNVQYHVLTFVQCHGQLRWEDTIALLKN